MTLENFRPVLAGKKALVVGIANEHSIAWGCAKAFHELGAELAITYANDKTKAHTEPLAASVNAPIFLPLDVTREEQLDAVFDQIDQPEDLLRFAPATGVLERIPLPSVTANATAQSTLPLPDGRVLLTGRVVGRDRVLVMAPWKDPVPFIANDEETTGPLAMVGQDTFVFVAGTVPTRTLALASVASPE